MDWRLIAAIIVGLVVLVLLKELAKKGVSTGNYQIRGPLLTKAERSFYGVLQQAVGENYSVFSKVRVADVLAPAKGMPKKEWRSAFNRISAKHFDFVLCDPGSLTVEFVLELNDKSHGRADRSKRDAFIREACSSAGLRLVEINAKASYSTQELRSQLIEPVATNDLRKEPHF